MKKTCLPFEIYKLADFVNNIPSLEKYSYETYAIIWVTDEQNFKTDETRMFFLPVNLIESSLPEVGSNGYVITFSQSDFERLSDWTHFPFYDKLFHPFSVSVIWINRKIHQVLLELLNVMMLENQLNHNLEIQQETLRSLLKAFLLRVTADHIGALQNQWPKRRHVHW